MDTGQAVVTVMRSGGFRKYVDDPPLSQIGRAGAELVGRSLSERSFHIHTIYTSPSLRCLQVRFNMFTQSSISNSFHCITVQYFHFELWKDNPVRFAGVAIRVKLRKLNDK